MTESVAPETPDANPEQTAMIVAKVRRLMVIASLTVALGIGAIFTVIGYRVFRSEGSVQSASQTVTLPKGARIVSTGVSGDLIVITLDHAGVPEVRTFDSRTLKPVGRMTFAAEP
jgi:hypothetical protein